VSVPVMKRVTARTVRSDRLTTRVLSTGHRTETPVLFLHGNLSAAARWEDTMLRLPPGFRGLAPELRGFGKAYSEQKIDARQGLGDVAADVVALLDALGVDRAHVVGNPLGACVIWRCLDVYPHQPMLAQTRATLDRHEAEGARTVRSSSRTARTWRSSRSRGSSARRSTPTSGEGRRRVTAK